MKGELIMASADPTITVDLALNDQVTPKLRAIQEEFGTLLEVSVDRWPMVAAAWSFATFLAMILVLMKP